MDNLIHNLGMLLQVVATSTASSTHIETDSILAAAIGGIGVLISIIGFFIKKRMDLYDRHLEECNRRAIVTGQMNTRVERVERDVRWVGNSIVSIGTKLGVELPEKSD